jgi:hypothetical protein
MGQHSQVMDRRETLADRLCGPSEFQKRQCLRLDIVQASIFEGSFGPEPVMNSPPGYLLLYADTDRFEPMAQRQKGAQKRGTPALV